LLEGAANASSASSIARSSLRWLVSTLASTLMPIMVASKSRAALGGSVWPDNPGGYVEIDKNTMRHSRFDNIFALGDAGSSPNSTTGAAIRKQAPVVAANLQASLAGQPLPARYGGYACCPLTTARDKMLLAEFD